MASTETGPPGPGPPGPPSRPYEAGAPARSARGWQRQLGLQLSRPWARWPLTGLAWAAALALIGFMSFTALASTGHQLLADLHVYRTGGQSVLAGRPLYGALTNGKLLFTYPPVSAVLAVPLAWVPWRAAQFLWLPMILRPAGRRNRAFVPAAAGPGSALGAGRVRGPAGGLRCCSRRSGR